MGQADIAKVQDRRFEPGDWPIRVDVPQEQADSWLKYFYAQCEKYGWSTSSLGQWFRPQNMRNAHLHTGEFRGSEFVYAAITSSYHDPTFGQARRALALITQAAIIEWLQRYGAFTMPFIQRKMNPRRWVKEHILVILPSVLATGMILGWLLRTFSSR
jgi:hypothetical protein